MSSANIKPKDTATTSFKEALFDIPEIPRNSGQKTQHLNDLRNAVIKSAQVEGYAVGIEQGRSEGFAVGYAEGETQALILAQTAREAMLQQFAAELGAIGQQVRAAIPAWCHLAEEGLTDRVIQICRQVLSRELELDRNSVLEIVQTAMLDVTHSRSAKVRVNPLDAHLVMKHKDQLLIATRTLEAIDVVADPLVAGGCIIETEGGTVGASIEAQLEVLEGRLEREAA